MCNVINIEKIETAYQKAIGLMKSKSYHEAIVLFNEIKEYEDSGEKIKICN